MPHITSQKWGDDIWCSLVFSWPEHTAWLDHWDRDQSPCTLRLAARPNRAHWTVLARLGTWVRPWCARRAGTRHSTSGLVWWPRWMWALWCVLATRHWPALWLIQWTIRARVVSCQWRGRGHWFCSQTSPSICVTESSVSRHWQHTKQQCLTSSLPPTSMNSMGVPCDVTVSRLQPIEGVNSWKQFVFSRYNRLFDTCQYEIGDKTNEHSRTLSCLSLQGPTTARTSAAQSHVWQARLVLACWSRARYFSTCDTAPSARHSRCLRLIGPVSATSRCIPVTYRSWMWARSSSRSRAVRALHTTDGTQCDDSADQSMHRAWCWSDLVQSPLAASIWTWSRSWHICTKLFGTIWAHYYYYWIRASYLQTMDALANMLASMKLKICTCIS